MRSSGMSKSSDHASNQFFPLRIRISRKIRAKPRIGPADQRPGRKGTAGTESLPGQAAMRRGEECAACLPNEKESVEKWPDARPPQSASYFGVSGQYGVRSPVPGQRGEFRYVGKEYSLCLSASFSAASARLNASCRSGLPPFRRADAALRLAGGCPRAMFQAQGAPTPVRQERGKGAEP